MKHGCGVFFLHSELKKKIVGFWGRFFQVIHFIVVADERASNRAVVNALGLSCWAKDFLLSPFFFLFLPLALSFWYWCLQLCSWTAVHNSTDPSFSRVTQSARVRGHTRGDWFKVQIASERIQRRTGRKKKWVPQSIQCSMSTLCFTLTLANCELGCFSWIHCLHCNMSYVFPHIFCVTCQNNFHLSSEHIIDGFRNKQTTIHQNFDFSLSVDSLVMVTVMVRLNLRAILNFCGRITEWTSLGWISELP